MSGIILNVTDLNSTSNHMRSSRNDIGEIIVENIEEKRNEKRINGMITSDINSNTKKAETATTTTTPTEITQHETPSIESLDNNTRSITLDHKNNGYDDSSVFDSSSDMDSDFDDIIQSPSSYLNNVNLSSSNGFVMIDKNLHTQNNDVRPTIGSIAVQNSSDITFGNKTFYQGPVTIKQFVYDKNKWRETKLPSTSAASEDDDLGSTKMDNDEEDKKWRCTSRQSLFGSAIGGILACLLLVVIVIIKYSGSETPHRKSPRFNPDDEVITNSSGDLRVVYRREWLAEPPKAELIRLTLPVSRVIIAHTAGDNCTTLADCAQQVRNIQAYHNEQDFDDIGYNFLSGGDNAIYVGRAWDWVGAHTLGYNNGSICFAFMGTFTSYAPPKRQLETVQQMLVEGIKLKKLTPDYRLYGHKQLINILSPGKALYEVIKKWDHWSDKVDPPYS